ncbi:MAG: PepSY domain-containing protein [Zoogloeaceae bacterium]|jgi:uncharacterized iron-regulated membrane protein|nr:PepSY domain-containing protein [Zoogloeaceae bacterium]
MSWLHTWSGLVLGGLLFAIFVTGTLSFFRNEMTFWMQPELHKADARKVAFDRALRVLEQEAPDATQWSLTLPGPRNPTLGLSWQSAEGSGEGRPERPQGGAAGFTGAGEHGFRREGQGQSARAGSENDAGGGVGATERNGQGGEFRRGNPAARESGAAGVAGAERRGGKSRSGERTTQEASGEPAAEGAGETADEAPARSRRSGEFGEAGGQNAGSRQATGEFSRQGRPEAGALQARSSQQAQGQGGGGGGRRGPRVLLNPATGEKLTARETAGGNFLYRFHFELYGMDRIWGRWIVGIATMFMLVAIITGVIVHRNIFKDFFTFRPAKGKRSWLDAHNASSVLSLPFHFVITFSGLLLFGNMLFPSALQSVYHGDMSAYMQEMRARMTPAETPPPSGERAPLTDLAALVAAAESAWGGRPAGSITITNPGDRRAVVELRQARGMSLAAGRASAQSLRFDGVSGQPLDAVPPPSPSVVQSISNVFMMLHRGFFASSVPRWLLFLAGVGGSLMIATGLVMWRVARKKNQETTGRIPFGHRLVEVTNVAGISGLLVAIAGYFWASRLIPADLPQRSEWEIKVFFSIWFLTLIHALVRQHKAAWVEQLSVAGGLIAFLPVLNVMTGGLSLFGGIALNQWITPGFDLAALAIGGSLFFAACRVELHQPGVRAEKPQTLAATPASPQCPPEAAPSTEDSRLLAEAMFPLSATLQTQENR